MSATCLHVVGARKLCFFLIAVFCDSRALMWCSSRSRLLLPVCGLDLLLALRSCLFVGDIALCKMADADFALPVPPLHSVLRLMWSSHDGLGATWMIGYQSGDIVYVYNLTLWGFYATGLALWAPPNRNATTTFPFPVESAHLALLHTTSNSIGGSWRLGYIWRETMLVYQLVLWDRNQIDLNNGDDDADGRDDTDDTSMRPTTTPNHDNTPGSQDSDVEAALAEAYAGADSECTSCGDNHTEMPEVIDDIHDDD